MAKSKEIALFRIGSPCFWFLWRPYLVGVECKKSQFSLA